MADAADQRSTRQQASRALADPDPLTRRAAASQLGEVGRMGDVAVLVKALRDSDEETRAAAEGAIWGIWGRSGYGLIYAQMNQPERTLGYFKRALKINPNMQGVARNIELLQKQADEKRKSYI